MDHNPHSMWDLERVVLALGHATPIDPVPHRLPQPILRIVLSNPQHGIDGIADNVTLDWTPERDLRWATWA